MNKNNIINLIGFLLFVIGFMSIFLSLVGLNFTFLSWLNNAVGNSMAFLIHLSMIVSGLIIIYVNIQLKNRIPEEETKIND
jgi:hypothetical protein